MVLIVEDNQDTFEFVQRILKRQNIESRVARNGQEALKLLREEPVLPDLILLDLMMPVMNGWEFMSEKLADDRLVPVPVVVCSAVEPGGLGKVGYLAKPVDPAGLIAKVREYIAAPASS